MAVAAGPSLDQLGVGIVDLEFLLLSQPVAIVVPASAVISPPQSALAHFLYPPAQEASGAWIGSVEGLPWVVHKDFVSAVTVSLVVNPPPSSLSLFSPSPLQLAWAAAIADSSGQGRSRVFKNESQVLGV